VLVGYATSILGASGPEVVAYVAAMSQREVGDDLDSLLRRIQRRAQLESLINLAGEHLADDSWDPAPLRELLVESTPTAGVCLAEVDAESPVGLRLPYEALETATGGLYGLWVIAAEPGVGKSTLAWQIALHVGQQLPVHYFDFELTPGLVAARLDAAYPGMRRDLTRRVYYHQKITDLEALVHGDPSVIVIDSFQKLPANLEHRRAGLDRWMRRLEEIKQQGHHILVISEKDRMSYERASLSAFKESGAIEYAADVAIQLVRDPDLHDELEIHVVKNRHHPARGKVSRLIREGSWAFREASLEAALFE
jgi:hypothetical protein